VTTKTNFLGIPVEGDINKADERTPQKPLSELEPLIRAVLDDPTMKAFGWNQYTPYFNDGDPCVFRVNGPWFLTEADPDPDDVEDHYDFSMDSDHPSLGKRVYDWRNKVYGPYEGSDEARYDRVKELAGALEAGAFENVLLEAFGDHAQVTVRASGITVDFYSHD